MKKGVIWAAGLLVLAVSLAACGVKDAWLITGMIAVLATTASFFMGKDMCGTRFVLGLAIVPFAVITGLAIYATALDHTSLFGNLADLALTAFGEVSGGIVAICAIAAATGWMTRSRRESRNDAWQDELLGRRSRG